MIKKFCLIVLFFPVLLFAQRGTLKPDVKPEISIKTIDAKITIDDDIKTWQVSDGLFVCGDTSDFCYEVKENGITKMIHQKDVFGFFFEDGNKYTITVKAALKKPPLSADETIYTYTLVKIISKKPVENYALIPTETTTENKFSTISKDANSIPIVTDQQTIVTPVPPATTSTETKLQEEISALKKQLKDLQKQIETMQLQLDMQLQLFLKK
ncbi:MAG TPA: DUF4377 domain-containing protein [Chitinophagales bacterium]|nr:DUF4377 domain-containing protein [Chitinophagales bacterium]